MLNAWTCAHGTILAFLGVEDLKTIDFTLQRQCMKLEDLSMTPLNYFYWLPKPAFLI